MDKVLNELECCVMVKDPYLYCLSQQIRNSIIDRKYFLMAFYKGGVADRLFSNDIYWKQVNYSYLKIDAKRNNLVWYEFQAKHTQIVN
jgi:hypothetical protein